MTIDRTFDFAEQPLFSASEHILQRVQAKGWHLYDSESGNQERTIARGPIESGYIRPGRYVLLPRIENARSPSAVMGELEQFALRNNREMPTVMIMGDRTPLTGFRFEEHRVKVNTPAGDVMSYRDLLTVLDTLTDVTNPKAL